MSATHKSLRWIAGWLAIAVFAVIPPAWASDAGGNDAAPFSVRLDTWTDSARGRDIPVKLYIPDGVEARGVLIFSHGLGGSREAAAYLGERAASEGMLGVFMQHPGSDETVWRGLPPGQARGALAAAANARTAIARFMDLPFVIDALEARVADGEIRADLSRIAIAGHSYGAHSALAAVGRAYMTPQGAISVADPRVSAAIALSPPPFDEADSANFGVIFGSIDRPILHVTGTRDDDPLRATASPQARLVAFREITGPPQYLVVFEDGDHMVFSGREAQTARGRRAPAWYSDVQADVADLTILFLNAHLFGDDGAASLLAEGDLSQVLRHPAQIDRKAGSDGAGR